MKKQLTKPRIWTPPKRIDLTKSVDGAPKSPQPSLPDEVIAKLNNLEFHVSNIQKQLVKVDNLLQTLFEGPEDEDLEETEEMDESDW